jgi:hypothetical protein
MNARTERPVRLRVLRALIVVTLVLLTAQGWVGDRVNLFVTPPNPVPPPSSVGGLLHAVDSVRSPFLLLWHTFEGLVLVVLSAAVLVLSFTWSQSRWVRIWSVLGLAAVVSAAVGGYLFVKSGFADDGGSAQMGGSFIGSYACYFLALYYTR